MKPAIKERAENDSTGRGAGCGEQSFAEQASVELDARDGVELPSR
jgi:hypothetical protein